ncbi:hypothetical protein LTR36_008574 [Oleoguttula mirabilis]|uniref:2EXR domain-containing protein n=1 Tax=Oleoguttula mirabilis TaxID=1507867 RepID=A0AAV9JTP4_9PEZI|nr:hypothetical protein LTR36_008574 [Oleoguttula mirabilis]
MDPNIDDSQQTLAEAPRPMNQNTASSAIQNPPASPLLSLPPELRNRIYRFTLVEAHAIRITADQHEQPNLLHANRQLRSEARAIYMQEKDFELVCHDMRPELPANLLGFWLADVHRRQLYCHITGDPS